MVFLAVVALLTVVLACRSTSSCWFATRCVKPARLPCGPSRRRPSSQPPPVGPSSLPPCPRPRDGSWRRLPLQPPSRQQPYGPSRRPLGEPSRGLLTGLLDDDVLDDDRLRLGGLLGSRRHIADRAQGGRPSRGGGGGGIGADGRCGLGGPDRGGGHRGVLRHGLGRGRSGERGHEASGRDDCCAPDGRLGRCARDALELANWAVATRRTMTSGTRCFAANLSAPARLAVWFGLRLPGSRDRPGGRLGELHPKSDVSRAGALLLYDARRNCGSPAPAMRVTRHRRQWQDLASAPGWTPNGEGGCRRR